METTQTSHIMQLNNICSNYTAELKHLNMILHDCMTHNTCTCIMKCCAVRIPHTAYSICIIKCCAHILYMVQWRMCNSCNSFSIILWMQPRNYVLCMWRCLHVLFSCSRHVPRDLGSANALRNSKTGDPELHTERLRLIVSTVDMRHADETRLLEIENKQITFTPQLCDKRKSGRPSHVRSSLI